MARPLASIRFPKSSLRPPPLASLAPERLPGVFILDESLSALKKWDGPTYHRLIGDWLLSGLSSGSELKEWLLEKLSPLALSSRSFEKARLRAEKRLKSPIDALLLSDTPHTGPGAARNSCPRVLYKRGGFEAGKARVVVFNSRKPKQLFSGQGWMIALRRSLEHFSGQDIELASSIGTLTYDLVTAWAGKNRSPLLLVLPFAFEEGFKCGSGILELLPGDLTTCTLLSCQTAAVRCEKAVRMTCRDRMLARLADFYWILELRSGGNLQALLNAEQSIEPRPQLILKYGREGSQERGNLELIKAWPKQSKFFFIDESIAPADAASELARSGLKEESEFSPVILWDDFLYHYTRACPGPWPGQTYLDYLLSLLGGDPLCAHTALDTLMRILAEGRIRAGSRLVRGSEPVVSWSGVAPNKLFILRQWNRALMRWTVEPYGIAVKRSLLRKAGAKPTVYGAESVHSRLDPAERYRFQRHEGSGCMWKHEREWRLRGDFVFEGSLHENGFIFVPDNLSGEKLRLSFGNELPVRVVEAGNG